jgi:predicted O-methyltransferase YrrM
MNTIESQLHPMEKRIFSNRVATIPNPTILEIGTYKGGGSTLTFLEALKHQNSGRLIGIEADPDVFAEMKANIASVDPGYFAFFEPIIGFSQSVIPGLLTKYSRFDLVFLDGGNNPREQIEEFELLKDAIPVGGFLFSHDANLRKGHWLVPYLSELDNWRVTIHQASEEGLLEAEKKRVDSVARELKSSTESSPRPNALAGGTGHFALPERLQGLRPEVASTQIAPEDRRRTEAIANLLIAQGAFSSDLSRALDQVASFDS